MKAGTVLVTGGAGFIGSHVVDHLVANGASVVVLDDLSSGSIDNLSRSLATHKVKFLRGSVLDEQALGSAVTNCTSVIHMAVECVRRSIGDPLKNHHINATGTILTLEAARKAKIEKFVYCSSSEIYGNSSSKTLNERTSVPAPTTVYGAAKYIGEHYTHAYRQTYGMQTTVVRPFNAFGPREHHRGDLAEVIPRVMIRLVKGLEPIIFGDGLQGRDFTHVTDVARGIVLALQESKSVGEVINIARGEVVSIGRLAKIMAQLIGRADLNPIYMTERPGDVRTLHADVAFAQELLNYKANVTLSDGLSDYIKWFQETYSEPHLLLETIHENWNLPADELQTS